MKVMLLRHGMTAGNEFGRYIGKTDEPLSGRGTALAREAADQLAAWPDFREFDKTVTVTRLVRTQQTASILFPTARQVIAEGLEEMDFGDFENRSADEMAWDEAYRQWVDGNCFGRCPGGESREEFSARVCRAFEKRILAIMSADGASSESAFEGGVVGESVGRSSGGAGCGSGGRAGSETDSVSASKSGDMRETAVFVVHGGTIMAVMERYARPPMDFYAGHTKNCGGFICTVSCADAEELPFVLTDVKRLPF